MPKDVDTSSRVCRVLSNFLKIPGTEIKPHSRLVDELGVDSVDFWEIVAKMEREFQIEIREGESLDIETVDDIVKVIEQKMRVK